MLNYLISFFLSVFGMVMIFLFDFPCDNNGFSSAGRTSFGVVFGHVNFVVGDSTLCVIHWLKPSVLVGLRV